LVPLAGAGTSSVAGATTCAPAPTHVGRFLGIQRPSTTTAPIVCSLVARSSASKAYNGGSPPLKLKGGVTMGTSLQPGAVTLTPVYWAPNQASFDSGYESLSTKFIDDLSAATTAGTTASPFSVLTQYTNASGTRFGSQMTATPPIVDTQAYPDDANTTGCSPDSGAIYNDDSGYSLCISDADIMAEVQRLTTDQNLPTDWSHLYVVYLPKGVEECFSSDPHSCTANHVDTADSFCAYHSYVNPAPTAAPMLYAVIPYSVWNSKTGIGCDGLVDSPNADPAVDYSVSAVSHEIAEAITDPEGYSQDGLTHGWRDKNGNEIGDLCAYVYGALHGTSGQRYNVRLNGSKYLIQQEFSNSSYKLSHAAGCQTGWTVPSVSLRSTGKLTVGKLVTFQATVSTPSGAVLSRSWTLDGQPAGSGATFATRFVTAGSHTVALTVTDSGGYQGVSSLPVTIKTP
jgi:PKD domain